MVMSHLILQTTLREKQHQPPFSHVEVGGWESKCLVQVSVACKWQICESDWGTVSATLGLLGEREAASSTARGVALPAP